MKRNEVLNGVTELSGVDRDTCEKVIDALEKVLQKELGGAKGIGGALSKVTMLMNYLNSRKER